MKGNKLGPEGGKVFAEALPNSSLTSLKCAAAQPMCSPFCGQGPLNTFTSSALTLTLPRSLASNNLTNSGRDMSGVIKLAEALPKSKLQSLECAAAHVLAFLCSAPDEQLYFSCTSPTHSCHFLCRMPHILPCV